MKGAEFLRKLQRLAKARGVALEFRPKHGNGSHGRIMFGDRATFIPDLKHEVGRGLLRDICRQLDIDPRDL